MRPRCAAQGRSGVNTYVFDQGWQKERDRRPCPAYVLTRTSDLLAANPEALALFTAWPTASGLASTRPNLAAATTTP